MTLDDLRYLRSAEGEALLREAQDLPGDELATLTRLRKRFDGDRCRSTMALLAARERGKRKFCR